jgi:zinc transporter, ZIP family
LFTSNVWIAMGLTVFAGLSTGLGGLFVCIYKKTNAKLLSVALGFSAGIMIYVSFVEFFSDSKNLLMSAYGKSFGYFITILSFFGGMLFIAVVDKLVPSYENPHESHRLEETDEFCALNGNKKLLRTGLFTALIIGIHNFPEGMATFVSSFHKPTTGIAIAFAVAIHNIPEGIAVAMPVYCATGSRKKAFRLSLLSGLAEPVGAIIAYLILLPILNDAVFGILFAAIAGIMVFISLDELLPAAREYGESHLSMYGLILGMIVMSLSLLFLNSL